MQVGFVKCRKIINSAGTRGLTETEENIDKYTSFNKKIFDEVMLFINQYFLNDEEIKIQNLQTNKYSRFFKYQQVSKVAIKQKFKEIGKELKDGWSSKIDNFINENYFQLAGICKAVTSLKENADVKLSEDKVTLPGFIIAHISSFLKAPSLFSHIQSQAKDNITLVDNIQNQAIEMKLAGDIED